MANQQKYFLGPSLLSDIRSTISRVDAIAPRTSGPAQEVRLQGLQQPMDGVRLSRGTFSGSWAVGETKAVTIQGGTQTISVTNYCVPVSADTASTQVYNVIFGVVMGTQTAVEVQQSAGLIRVGKVDSEWAFGTCAEITVWEQTDTGCVPTHCSGGSGERSGVEVYLCEDKIQNVANLSHNVPAESWVIIGKAANGRWYLLESGKDTGTGSCRKTIGGEDITKWPGWAANKEQILGHDASGCLKWFDTTECEEGTGQ